jgi:TRAP-type uncharacterized transport system substrate-binding protein
LVAFVVCGLSLTFACARRGISPDDLVLAAGPQESAQACVARSFTTSLNQEASEVRVTVLATNGAVDSLVAPREGRAELAIATADVLAQAVNGEGPFARETVSARVVSTLYTSGLHLVVLGSSQLIGLSQLRDRMVGLGPQGSGMDLTVERALGAALLDRRVTRRAQPWPGLLSSLDRGTLAGFFWLDAVPSPALLEADMASETVFAVTSALFRLAPALGRACPAIAGLTTATGARPQPAALHPGAALFYRQMAPAGR